MLLCNGPDLQFKYVLGLFSVYISDNNSIGGQVWVIFPQRIFGKSGGIFGNQNGGIALVFVRRGQQNCVVGHASVPKTAHTISQRRMAQNVRQADFAKTCALNLYNYWA